MNVHRRDAHGAVREVRDGERVWWNGHTSEYEYEYLGITAKSD